MPRLSRPVAIANPSDEFRARRLLLLLLLLLAIVAWSAAVLAEPGFASEGSKEAAQPEWLGSRAGMSDEVLPPWTPVEVSGPKVDVWGRTYTFGDLPLPASIVTRKTEVLAAPITLAAVADGEKLAWTGLRLQTAESKPHRAQLAAEADSAGLRCAGTVSVEYDGMVRCDFKLVPKRNAVSLDRLTLEVPIRPEYAKYLHYWPGRWGSCANSMALPEEGYRGGFKPFFWLGDEWRGLAWFSESDRGFSNAEEDGVIDVRREADAVVLRVHVVTGPQRVSVHEPLEYTFGFQATPVKPAQPDVWDYRICHMGAYGLEERTLVEPTSIRYPAEGNLRLDRGTFECWVRPRFDTRPDVSRDDPRRGRLNRNLLDVDLPGGGHVGFYWNVDDRGMRLYYKQGDDFPLLLSTHAPLQAGRWHHVAFTWGDVTRVYVDGREVARRDYEGTVSGSLENAHILLGNSPSEMEIDEVRVSAVAREAFDLAQPPAADAQTLLLDRLDETRAPESGRATTAARGSGGQVQGGRFVEGKFGRAFSCAPDAAEPVLVLDRLRDQGVRTICFHEQWTDTQAYPKTTHGEKLRKLVDACHRRGIQLLLYHGYEMSTIAPEWDEYHEKCLVHPRRGGYKRKYQPEIDQTAYVVCYRSVWQDFLAHHLDKLIAEYGIDGVYLDGTSEPWGCANRQHGCGYERADGTIGKTYPFFDTRSMMKRIYTIVKAHNSEGQVNVHQSTCMTIPTLSFATSYWDGEQLQSVRREGAAEDVLPIDAFRCEFMGHNWGVPAELLHYRSGPFERFECVSLALLHDVLVRPSALRDVDHSAKLWKAMDALGRDEAAWLPYWENGECVRADPPQVKVSLYNRPGKGFLAVVANMGQNDCDAEVTFNLQALDQPGELTARDVVTGRPIPTTGSRLQLSLGSLEHVMVRLEPRE